MATLTLRSATTTRTVSGTTLSLTKPTGVASGDLLFAVIQAPAGAASGASGWTASAVGTGTFTMRLFVFHKVATASEPASYKFVVKDATSAGAVLLDYYGSAALTTHSIENTISTGGVSTAPAVKVKDSGATDLVVWCLASATVGAAGPSGFTKEAVSTPGTTLCGVWQKAPGAATTATYTGSQPTSKAWVLSAVVLTPSSAPSAPSLLTPTANSYHTVTTGLKFTATYNSTDGANCNAYALKIVATTVTKYYNATSAALQATIKWNTCSVTPGTTVSVTVPSGVLSNGTHYAWSMACQEALNNLQGAFASTILFTAGAGADVSIQAPLGIETSARPTVKWTATPGATLTIISYRVVVFTTAQHGVTTFTPATSPNTYDSGTVTGNAASAKVGTTLKSGTKYFAYVRATETGTVASSWAHSTFTVSFDEPAKPTITATNTTTATSGCPYIEVTVQCHDNLLTTKQASFETGTTGWTAGATMTIAQVVPPVTAPDGSYALSLTPTAAGTRSAHTTTGKTGFAVEATTEYTVRLEALAVKTSRQIEMHVEWYDATGTALSSSVAWSSADSTTAWTAVSDKITSPATAAFGAVYVEVVSASGTTDVHDIDVVGVFPGSVTTWTAGGFAGTTKLRVERDTTTTTRLSAQYKPFWVRTASTLTPSTVPVPSQKVTVKTFEAVQGVTYAYTGTVYSGTQSTTGTASAGVKLTVTPKRWWELDPTTPTGATNVQPTAWQPAQIEQSTAHQVMGQTTMQIIANVMLTQDFQATFVTFTQPSYKAFRNLMASQKIMWISSPWGDEDSGWFRVGPRPGGLSTGMGNKVRTATLHPSVSGAPYRNIMVTAVAQKRPTA